MKNFSKKKKHIFIV
jgi:hypothetical protein